MALLGEESSNVAVISYTCKSGKYPSVAARHPPAIRLERAIRDLFGLDAVDAPDTRPWLDLGFWNVRHPLGKKGPAHKPVPYKFLLPRARDCAKFRSDRCTRASLSRVIFASLPMASTWCG